MNQPKHENPPAFDDEAEQFAEFDQLVAVGESPPNVPDALRADVDFVSQLRKKWSAGRPSHRIGAKTRLEWMSGRLVNGYQIIRKRGQGNGEAYEAAKDNGKPIALKRIFLDDDFGRADQKSLNILKPITNHPHLVSIFEWWPISEANELGIVMELGDESLDKLIGKVEQKVLLKYMKDAAEGLDYLHSKNLIHQDVKPSNLFLFGGTVKVGDYSGVRPLKDIEADAESGKKLVSTCIVTDGYNDLDHKNGRPSFKSDQYGLAVTYLEIRTGKGSTSQDLTNLEPAEAAVVTKALSKVPTNRFRSCGDFVSALEKSFDNPASLPATFTDRPGPIPTTRPKQSALMPVAMIVILATALIAGVPLRNGVPPEPALPDFTGEWDYVCTAQTKAYEHGGVCTMTTKRTEYGIAFTIFGERRWMRVDEGERVNYKTGVDWESTWGMLTGKDYIRFEYLVQLPEKGNVVGYGRGKVTFEDGKPVQLQGMFNQSATNDPLFGSMVFTKKK